MQRLDPTEGLDEEMFLLISDIDPDEGIDVPSVRNGQEFMMQRRTKRT